MHPGHRQGRRTVPQGRLHDRCERRLHEGRPKEPPARDDLPRYIDSQTPEDLQDIAGHLQGGIPAADIDALQRYWDVCPKLRAVLFKKRRPGYLDAVDHRHYFVSLRHGERVAGHEVALQVDDDQDAFFGSRTISTRVRNAAV